MQVIVVGAGILGAATARELAIGGADVTVVERDRPGAGATGTTFAWLNANRKPQAAYHALNVAGMAEHVRLAHALPEPRWRFASGSIHCADAASETWLAENVEALRDRGYAARWVDRVEAARIAGDVRIPSEITAIAAFDDEGYVHPEPLLASIVDDARRHGARFVRGEATSLHDDASGVAVTLADGARLRADRLVLAAGLGSDALAATAGLEVPMATDARVGASIVGMLGMVERTPAHVRSVVYTPRLNLRPSVEGGLVVQALDLNARIDPGAPPTGDDPVTAEVRDRLAALLPEGAPTPDVRLRVAIRPMPADGLTIAGFAAPGSRVYALVTHSGITLGPLLGRLAADEVLGRGESAQLAPFRPSRLAGLDRATIEVQRPTMLGQQ